MATSRAFLSKLSSSPLLRRSFSSSATRLRPLVAPLDQLLLFKQPAVNNLVARRSMSTHQTNSSLRDSSPNFSNRPPKETILLDGCDFEHWLVVMDPPPGDPASPDITRDEIIDSYIKTLAQVVGSEQEARMKIYSVSTRHYFAFGALVSEELSYKIKELPHVRWVLPDSYLDVRNKDYGGEPFVNGEAMPYDPKYHEEWVRNNARANERSRRNDRPRNFDRSRNFERRRDNAPPPSPQQQTYQNTPPHPNMPAPPPPQNFNNPPPGGPSHGPPGGAPGPYPGGPGGYPQQGGGYERRPVYNAPRQPPPPQGYGNPNPNLGPNPNLEQGGYQGGPPNMNRGGPGGYQGGYQGGNNMNQGYQGGPGAYQGGGGNYERGGGPGAYGPSGGPGAYEGGGGQGAGGYNGYQGRDVPGRDYQ